MASGLALLVAVAFLPVLGNDFVNWDDPLNFLENPNYRGLGWSQIRWMLTAAWTGHWIPVTWVTLEVRVSNDPRWSRQASPAAVDSWCRTLRAQG